MVDKAGEEEIRGIDIDKLAKGFADEDNVLKKYVNVATTKARELRFYQKTSGFLDTPTTDDTAISMMYNTSQGALPPIAEQSWTRVTKYVKTFAVESPLLSNADITDNDVDLITTTVRDLVRAVERKVDLRIFAMLFDALETTPTQPLTNGAVTVQNTAATAAWNLPATMDPILDIENGKQKIRAYGYDSSQAVIGMNSVENKRLMTYLINTKGSSFPQFASDKLTNGVLMQLLGNKVIVSENFTTAWVYQWIPERAATWKEFTPVTSAKIEEPLVGVKIRVIAEGELLLHDPKAVHVISGTA